MFCPATLLEAPMCCESVAKVRGVAPIFHDRSSSTSWTPGGSTAHVDTIIAMGVIDEQIRLGGLFRVHMLLAAPSPVISCQRGCQSIMPETHMDRLGASLSSRGWYSELILVMSVCRCEGRAEPCGRRQTRLSGAHAAGASRSEGGRGGCMAAEGVGGGAGSGGPLDGSCPSLPGCRHAAGSADQLPCSR